MSESINRALECRVTVAYSVEKGTLRTSTEKHREGVEAFNGDTSYYVSTKEYYTAPKNIQLFKIHYFEHAGLVGPKD